MSAEELVAFVKRLKSLDDFDAAIELNEFEHKCKIDAIDDCAKWLREGR